MTETEVFKSPAQLLQESVLLAKAPEAPAAQPEATLDTGIQPEKEPQQPLNQQPPTPEQTKTPVQPPANNQPQPPAAQPPAAEPENKVAIPDLSKFLSSEQVQEDPKEKEYMAKFMAMYQPQLSFAEKASKNELVKMLVENLDQPGFDLQKVLSPVYTNYDSLSPEQLHIESLKIKGVNLEGEQLQIEKDSFLNKYNNMTPGEQALWRKQATEQMPQNTNKPEEYLKNFQQSRIEEQEKSDLYWKEKSQQMNQVASKYIGEPVLGYTITESDMRDVLNDIRNPNHYYDDNGDYQHQKEIYDRVCARLFQKHLPAMLDNYERQIRAQEATKRASPDKPAAPQNNAGGAIDESQKKQLQTLAAIYGEGTWRYKEEAKKLGLNV